jgi:hypothetical protein
MAQPLDHQIGERWRHKPINYSKGNTADKKIQHQFPKEAVNFFQHSINIYSSVLSE